MSDIFFSHVEEDAHLVYEMAAGLERAGYTGWYYGRDSLPGIPFVRQIPGVIDDAQAVVLVISPDALPSPHVNAEITEAYKSGKPFIPLLLGLSHSGFRQQRRDWALMLGAAVYVTVPTANVSEIVPRVVAGLKQMNVRPSGTPVAAPAPPAPPAATPSAPPAQTATPKLAALPAPKPEALRPASATTGVVAGSTAGSGGKQSPPGRTSRAPDSTPTARPSVARTPASSVRQPTPRRSTRRRFIGAVLPIALIGGGVAYWNSTRGPGEITLREVDRFEHDGPVLTLALHPTDPRMATGGGDGKIRLWKNRDDSAAGFDILAVRNWIRAAAFNHDGTLLATGSYDPTDADDDPQTDSPVISRFWDVQTLQQYGEGMLHRGHVFSVAFQPDGPYFATACEDSYARLWNMDQLEGGPTEIEHDSAVLAVAFRPNTLEMATGSRSGAVQRWDMTYLEDPKDTQSHGNDVVVVAYSPDGSTLASASFDGTVNLWNLDQNHVHGLGHGSTVRGLAFHPDRPLLATGDSEKVLRLWELKQGDNPQLLAQRDGAHDHRIRAAAFFPDGSRLATAGEDNVVKVWTF